MMSGEIVIWEKIDGANASFMRDGDTIRTFSRNNELTGVEDGLKGFRRWVLDNVDVNSLVEGFVYFGEWSTKHKINYGENHNKFYFFDIYVIENQEYASLPLVKGEAKTIGLELAPILYEGQFVSDEHLMSFVDKSVLSVDGKGEGIVIKNYAYKDKHGVQDFVKIVTQEFKEMNGGKAKEIKNHSDAITEFVKETATNARIEKLIYKLVDEGELNEDFSLKDMGTILRKLGSSVYDDVMKEERNLLDRIVKKKFGKVVPSMIRETVEKMEMGRA